MVAIITRANSYGEFDAVGTTNRIIVRGLRTYRGVHARARLFASGGAYKIEFYHDGRFYGDPFSVQYSHKQEFFEVTRREVQS
jgi:hypothetical protein